MAVQIEPRPWLANRPADPSAKQVPIWVMAIGCYLALYLWSNPLWAQEFAGGDGSVADPYQIETWEHLNNIRNHMSAHFVLNNDLTPETPGYATHVKDGDTLANGGEGWAPVGNLSASFAGTLDGNQHVIIGLEMARVNEGGVGLFGAMESSATVKNLRLLNINISGGNYTGGVVGLSVGTLLNVTVQGEVIGTGTLTGGVVGGSGLNGQLTRVSFYGTVIGRDQTGGLVGQNLSTIELTSARAHVTGAASTGGAIGDNGASISRLFSTGQVNGTDYVGGLVGRTLANVHDSYSSAQVTATNGVAGGLIGSVGSTPNDVEIKNSYSTGSVSGNSVSGGLVGNASRVSSPAFDITDSFWDVDASGIGSVGEDDVGAIGKTTADMKKQATFTNWDFTANTGDWLRVEDQTYPQLQALAFAGGEGTSANPYQIETWEHLNNIRLLLNAHFVLNNDLTPETPGYATHVKDGATLANGGKGWDPFGECIEQMGVSRCFAFTGTFDGNLQAIVGLEIARSSESEIGLFGGIGSTGTVTQLSLAAVDVSGGFRTGGLAGDNSGSISDVSVQGTVTGQNGWTGGAVGYNGSFGTLSKAGFNGSVQGENSTGGLVGVNIGTLEVSWARAQVTSTQTRVGGAVGYNQGSVDRVFTNGQVTGAGVVGGLIGLNLDGVNNDVNNSYAIAGVTGLDAQTTSGLVGSNGVEGISGGKIQNSYAAGVVNGGDPARAFVGTSVGDVAYSNNFFNTDVSGQTSATASSATGVSIFEMRTIDTFTDAGWDFDPSTGIWRIQECMPASYPYLAAITYDAPGTTPSTQPIPGLVQPIDIPLSVSAVRGNAESTVSWAVPSGCEGSSDVTGYTVTAIPGGASCTTTGATSCTVTGLNNGTPYTFQVVASSVDGDSISSAPSNTVTPATVPDAPTITEVTSGNAAVTIKFDAPVDDGGSVITGYTATSSPANITAANCTSQQCTVTGLTNGVAYTFTVAASNAVGAGPASEPSPQVTPFTVPAAPTNLVAHPRTGSIKMAFVAGDTGGSPIENYEVSLNGGTSWSPLTPADTASPITITGLSNDTEYSVMLRAINAAGAGPASVAVAACPSAMIFKDAFRQGGGNASTCP